MKVVAQSNDDFQTVVNQLPSIPHDEEGPVFAQPWEAEVFAMTLMLFENGIFTWAEWAEQLNKSIRQAQLDGDPDLGDTYYSHWLDALEKMIVSKQLGSDAQLTTLYSKWNTAARATPHGQAITLD